MAGPTLHTVILTECDSVTDEGISLLANHSPNLCCLNISKCSRLSGSSLSVLSKVSTSWLVCLQITLYDVLVLLVIKRTFFLWT